MNILSPDIRGDLQAVLETAQGAALPWGIPHIDAVAVTPKVHQMQWYTSGFI